jgi:hypothetical protein
MIALHSDRKRTRDEGLDRPPNGEKTDPRQNRPGLTRTMLRGVVSAAASGP